MSIITVKELGVLRNRVRREIGLPSLEEAPRSAADEIREGGDSLLRDDHWLAHRGARLMGQWLLGGDPIELRGAAFRVALAVRLFGRDGQKVMQLRRTT